MELALIIEKIKKAKSFKELFTKALNLLKFKFIYLRKNMHFILHNWLINVIYGKTGTHTTFKVSQDDVRRIKEKIATAKELKIPDIDGVAESVKQNSELTQKIIDVMNERKKWFELNRDEFIDELIKRLTPHFREYTKSPFAIIQLKAWATQPRIECYYDEKGRPRGAFREHKDGYPPGHCKCIVYLQPLDTEHGQIRLGSTTFESDEAGFSLIFNNNLLHEAITGKLKQRYCLEFTFMRTLKKVDVLKHRNMDIIDAVLPSPLTAYF